ncbi:DUF3299 domain-containing protein [Pseudomonas sp. NCCP-436]|uniref:DUF3299 domain-containing protein n=1 Tax=Pseudomonas sp. NCCP-436 TaxID=2842481 RepID=UPI001C8078DA|nr:DUF3299 domain-containing protein [Pseudomonas sp. NCCP-436]GIZ10616.1 hypothetical protein NCCP436_00320 [Pseudomonas sp. NCCP-436]
MRHLLFALLLLAGLARAELPETDWLDLMPPEDRQALEEMPDISHDSPEGNSLFYGTNGLRQQNPDLPAVMYSSKTVPELDGKAVRLGGYPVPLESDAQGNSTLFFLVPYPGACIHVPPPPPNQLVLVHYPSGLRLDDIYAPLWVSGKLRVESVSNELADAAYAMDAREVRAVTDEDLD